MNRAYKFRIYPNFQQQKFLYKEFAANKVVYNYYLGKSKEEYETNKKSLNFYDWCHDLTDLKKQEEYKWLAEVSSQTLIQTLRHLDSAYKNFFRNVKKGMKPGFPNFKKENHSIIYSNNCCEYIPYEHKIKLSKTGKIKTIDYIRAYGKLMNITISKERSGKWFASICVEQPDKIYNNQSEAKIGLDVGISNFLIDSEGNKIDNPKFLENSNKRLIFYQRQLSNKKIGSKNRRKARLKVAKMHEKISSQRSNFLHQNSTNLAKNNKLLVIENLDIKKMMHGNKRLARKISDVSWGEFFRQLGYKTSWYNSKLIKIDKYEPTSKTCSICGYINEELTIKDREWICPVCNTLHDRDINAAKNILRLGLEKESCEPLTE